MQTAMMAAELGDDVLGDDPTVIHLQEVVATLFGKEEACFVPSGTMGNQTAIRAHTRPGDEILAHEGSHIYRYEGGGPAAISGCQMCLIPSLDGTFDADAVTSRIKRDDAHFPRTRLIVIENTNNFAGGRVWSLAQQQAIADVAESHGLAMHLDGARCWNACAAMNVTPAELAAPFDTVSACFSKGLGAPVGSIVAGDHDAINQVRRGRKLLGGGMRQSGLLAAAALYALEHHRPRLLEDHARAARLAEALANMQHVTLDPAAVETNIVAFEIASEMGPAKEIQDRLEHGGVRLFAISPSRLRAVTHLDVDDPQIDAAIDILASILD
jgi:threonine aldolase